MKRQKLMVSEELSSFTWYDLTDLILGYRENEKVSHPFTRSRKTRKPCDAVVFPQR
jgi:hypothetical protein